MEQFSESKQLMQPQANNVLVQKERTNNVLVQKERSLFVRHQAYLPQNFTVRRLRLLLRIVSSGDNFILFN